MSFGRDFSKIRDLFFVDLAWGSARSKSALGRILPTKAKSWIKYRMATILGGNAAELGGQ